MWRTSSSGCVLAQVGEVDPDALEHGPVVALQHARRVGGSTCHSRRRSSRSASPSPGARRVMRRRRGAHRACAPEGELGSGDGSEDRSTRSSAVTPSASASYERTMRWRSTSSASSRTSCGSAYSRPRTNASARPARIRLIDGARTRTVERRSATSHRARPADVAGRVRELDRVLDQRRVDEDGRRPRAADAVRSFAVDRRGRRGSSAAVMRSTITNLLVGRRVVDRGP